MILQELNTGTFYGVDDDNNRVILTFDLSTAFELYQLLILNSGGTGAALPMWKSAQAAGVFAGEYMPEANLPADGSATTQPDGYILLGHN